jgi:DNA-binding transcriptional LysR family regulator
MSDDWERYRVFLAVLRTGSLSGAARALDIAQPTARSRIAELERTLGITLFTRAPDGLVPTDPALGLRQHAEAMELAGLVRVSASEVVAVEVLPPTIAALRARHPRLTIALSPSNRNEDLLRREADVAVRMVRPQQGALVARRIGAVELGLHVRADLLAGRAAPATLDDVIAFGLIGVESDNDVVRALRRQGIPIAVGDAVFRSDSDLAQLAAIRAGVGIGVCQVALARRDPGLVRVIPDFTHPLETWVVMHEDLRHSAPVRAVFDALVEGLGAYLAPAG